jgi:3-methyladenine DNA glycosylase/8-oxoguanine DNA glycosylase
MRTGFSSATVDLETTFFPLRRGSGDPTTRVDAREVWRATRTPDGPATLHVEGKNGGLAVEQPGRARAERLDRATGWLGLQDGTEAFDPQPGPVREAWRRRRGLRVLRTGLVVEHLIPTILEQKVTGMEARRAYRRMSFALGEPAPGPARLLLPPEPTRVAELPYFAMHPFGVERRRAEVIRSVCAKAGWLDAAADLSLDQAKARIGSMRGVGQWSVAEVSRLGLGDADAVSVGDYHVPNLVAWALAGESRGSDERMLELLEPYRPFRGLAQLLLETSGIRPPAFGPRMEPRAIERL